MIQLINSAGIDICTTYYIVKDVFGLVTQEYDRVLKLAQTEQPNTQEQEENKKEE